MKGELKMDVNDYLPLRDVVFNTLRPVSYTHLTLPTNSRV